MTLNFYKDKLTLDFTNKIFLAPMAGYTDRAFRFICKQYGADIMVSEMVSAKGLYYKDKRTAKLMRFEADERPFGIQLFGCEPDIIAYAVNEVCKLEPDFIDINMGCPAPKIVSNGDGSALMKNPFLAGEIIKAAVMASDIPVTVKIRTGWDENSKNAPELAEIAIKNGVSAITVHGRTRSQFYSPPVDTDIIRDVNNAVGHLIPVIANGDIKSHDDAVNMFNKTGVSSIMIGRGAIGNPFIFRDIKNNSTAFTNKENRFKERIQTALLHVRLMANEKGEQGIVELRKHLGMYFKGIKGSHKLNVKINTAKTLEQVIEIINMIEDVQNDTN